MTLAKVKEQDKVKNKMAMTVAKVRLPSDSYLPILLIRVV